MNVHVKVLIPVRVERLLDHTGGVRLVCVDSEDCERIWESEDIAFGEPVGGDNWSHKSDVSNVR